MKYSLLFSIYFHEGRYHGECDGRSEWPPSPFRFFQALVAATARGVKISSQYRYALEWLQDLDPPTVLAQVACEGQSVKNYVPNNDLDKYGGDLRKINKIRTPKSIHPHIFDEKIPLIFIWTFHDTRENKDKAKIICHVAKKIYQLGRGVDMAWAQSKVLDSNTMKTYIEGYRGTVYQPSQEGFLGTGTPLFCPTKGSLESLEERYNSNRITTCMDKNSKVDYIFSQQPKPYFTKVIYKAPSHNFLFELRTVTSDESFVKWQSIKTFDLVKKIRSIAASRLKKSLPKETEIIDRVLIGCGATEEDKECRVRILPLPSIGHFHADIFIRRVLIEVPSRCLLKADDLAWAFSGIQDIDCKTGEIFWNLVCTNDRRILKHYGVENSKKDNFHIWRTITPVVLPSMRVKRLGGSHEIVGAREGMSKTSRRNNRIEGEVELACTVKQALRHAGVFTPVKSILIQREPFDLNNVKSKDFIVPKRFKMNELRHLEINFNHALSGPLVLGDGRYFGLGLMAPKT